MLLCYFICKSKGTGAPVKLPAYKQVSTAVQHLKLDPDLVAMREGAKSVARPRASADTLLRRGALQSSILFFRFKDVKERSDIISQQLRFL
jgi:hypothetical protein